MPPGEVGFLLLILGSLATDSTLGDPCVTHTVLDQPWRSTGCSSTGCSGKWMDDGNLAVGWYRFNSSGGWKIPETPVPHYHCSGKYPGWLDGPHPSVGDGEVTRTVCFTMGGYICNWNREIRVKNCSGYFVYQLWPSPLTNAVYCTATDSTLGDPCVTHTVLVQPWRSTGCSGTGCSGGIWMGDSRLAVGWYRFNSSGGWKIPETAVPVDHCSGRYPGWLAGPHPSVGDGEVIRRVCFTVGSSICHWNRDIRVKNCTGYFVYQLRVSSDTNAVYCTATDATLGDPCVTHTVLNQPWRSTGCSGTGCSSGTWMSDGNLAVGWYRFTSSVGWKIPETAVSLNHCSGQYPGWLAGPHPSVGDGEVTRRVCFTTGSYICSGEREIRVKNCSGYFVYQLWPSPFTNAVYCTDTDSTLGGPCVTHTVLDQPWRSTGCSGTGCISGLWMGDGNLAVGWYRFNSSGGWKIPETAVPEDHCSGQYPGWLAGPHPSVGDGEVIRRVCFTAGSSICNWNWGIRVKNCTGYFVYQLWPSTVTGTVYCTDPASVPTEEPQETTSEPQETTSEPQETTSEPQETPQPQETPKPREDLSTVPESDTTSVGGSGKAPGTADSASSCGKLNDQSGDEDGEDQWIQIQVTADREISAEQVKEALIVKLREMYDDPDPYIVQEPLED